MRVRIVVFFCALAAGLATAGPALARNPQAAGLQVALRAQGLYTGPIDAIAGPRTVAAVRTFQRTHDLPVTGVANARTRIELGPLGRHLFGTRQLGRGSFGWDVAVLQFLLIRHGVNVPVNGYLDGPTLRGLRRFQRLSRLSTDGVGGPRTFAALRGSRVDRADGQDGGPHGSADARVRREARRLAHVDRARRRHVADRARPSQPRRSRARPPDRQAPARSGARGRRRCRARRRSHRPP